jgi:hypothetical protein
LLCSLTLGTRAALCKIESQLCVFPWLLWHLRVWEQTVPMSTSALCCSPWLRDHSPLHHGPQSLILKDYLHRAPILLVVRDRNSILINLSKRRELIFLCTWKV